MIAETLVMHGGDFIEWRDSSGYVGKAPRRLSPEKLSIQITKAPKALRIMHKASGTVLSLTDSAGFSKVIPGLAQESDLARPAPVLYKIEGHISDPAGGYLPRPFSLTLGTGAGHTIALYPSPLGAQFGKAGGIYGRIGFAGGAVAPWAMVILSVTPPSGPVLIFQAQADRHGEFRLPLERLPALTKATPGSTYAAALAVKTSLSAGTDPPLDPEAQPLAHLAVGVSHDGNMEFAAQLAIAIAPETVSRVVSPGLTHLVLKST